MQHHDVTPPPSLDDSPQLGAQLERALLFELRELYILLCTNLFKSSMRVPQIEVVPSRAKLGRWVPKTRTIELSRPFILEKPWGAVIEVLKHEMAHQYVWEVLGEKEETPHGPRFRSVCESLGIDQAASGTPAIPSAQGQQAPADEIATRRKIGERIAHLLALAESSNVHEAEAAMAAAHRLLLKHNIELRDARVAQGYVWKHLGVATGRTTEAERVLSLILSKHFFVEAIWIPVYRPRQGKRGSILEVCGNIENVEIAEYVHGYLMTTAERLWQEHKKAHQVKGDRDRRTFLAGVMTGMSDKLTRESTKSEEAGLVWIADGDLGKYFKKRHPHVRHIRYAGQRRSEAYVHGREAGQKIVIHKGMKEERTTERGLMLPPRRG